MKKNDYMSLDELITYLIDKPSKHTVNKWRSEGKIRYIIKGKKSFYSKSEIDKWEENDRQKNN